MRKLSLFVIVLGSLLFAGRASATTYYISYSSGSNANSGTSQASPWKTHPYMQASAGCTGTGSAPNYSHSAGDQFVFKQGDSWPNACFDMVIPAGGAAGNPDVYTFDPTWGTAGGTTGNIGQAVGTYQFSGGNSVINGGDGWNSFISDYGNNGYITFNGMELTNYLFSTSGTYGVNHMIELYQSQNVVVSNIYVHGWSHGSSGSDNLHVVSGYNTYNTNLGSRLTGSVIDGASDGGISGEAAYSIPIMDNNIVKNMTNGFVSQEDSYIHDNQIGPINISFDSTTHENCIEPDGPYSGITTHTYIYNNIFHDCADTAILAAGNNSNSGSSVYYVWNNVLWLGSANPNPDPFAFSAIGTGGGNAVYVWNNTVEAGNRACFRFFSQGGSWSVSELRNNHCISNNSLYDTGSQPPTVNSNNLTQGVSAAAAQGYTSSETPYAYAPTTGSQSTSATVQAGANLSSFATGSLATLALDTGYGGHRTTTARPSSGAWDIGAYQYSSSGASGAPSPPTNVKIVAVQ
jgi:hypothetical protein